MHSGRNYKLKEFILWTRRSIYWLILLSVVPTFLFEVFQWKWLAIPWVPVALIGTAAAFIAGFRNTQTYNRSWEARQIWGGIINSSRTWGIMAKDFIRTVPAGQTEKQIHTEMIYRHIAWLTALRFQLRESRVWENTKTKSENLEYSEHYRVAEWDTNLADELKPFLSADELNYILSKKNKATQIIALQSKRLRELNEGNLLENLCYIEMEAVLKEFYDHQGKSERIKNFPYPRQFASINLFFIRLFVFMVPFGMLKEFEKLGDHTAWLTIPFSVIVSWVFTSLEQVGESTENPFEGGANDVPITSISRTIEIDLRDMLDEDNLPPALTPVNNILM